MKYILFILLYFQLQLCAAQDYLCYREYESNEELFNCLYQSILEREAFSNIKNIELNLNFEIQALNLRQEFIEASNDVELLRAVIKLSNLRHDTHLRVNYSNSIHNDTIRETLIRFLPDFSSSGYSFFVSQFDLNNLYQNFDPSSNLQLGDEVIMVNGNNLEDHINNLLPFLNSSTLNRRKWDIAKELSQKKSIFTPDIYNDDITYTFKKSDGQEYTISLPYVVNSSGSFSNNINFSCTSQNYSPNYCTANSPNYSALGFSLVNVPGVNSNQIRIYWSESSPIL
jgi:hypothetical protein